MPHLNTQTHRGNVVELLLLCKVSRLVQDELEEEAGGFGALLLQLVDTVQAAYHLRCATTIIIIIAINRCGNYQIWIIPFLIEFED